MNEKEIYQHVKEIVIEKLCLEGTEVSLNSNFASDLKADFLDKLELVMAFEDKFETKISDREAKELVTVGDVVTYLKKYKLVRNEMVQIAS